MRKFYVCAVFVLLFSAGCGNSSDSGSIAENIEISECGGFGSEILTKLPDENGEEETDCSQLLVWNFDDSTGVLKIMNEDVNLNCCGEHSVKVGESSEEGYDFFVIDDSVNGARCSCDCMFDFGADFEINEKNSVKINLYTVIEEFDPHEKVQALIWSGTLDLAQKNGTVIVKERTSEYCY